MIMSLGVIGIYFVILDVEHKLNLELFVRRNGSWSQRSLYSRTVAVQSEGQSSYTSSHPLPARTFS
jgi:hypothetical protein